MQRIDLFGAAAAFETVRMPDGTEAAIPTEHAAVLYVNEQPAFRVVCTPQLLPQLALGRLLTEGWIASAEEVEQIAVCAEGLKVNIYLNHPLTARRAAAQEVSSCCTDNVALGSPVEVQPLRAVPHLDLQPGVGWMPSPPPERGPAALSGHPCSPQLLCAARGPHPLRLRGHRTPQCAGQGRGQRASGRCPPQRMHALHQRPRTDGYGAQSHPGRRSGTGEQDHAHRPVAGAGRRIRPAIRVWPETPLNFEGTYKIKVTKKRKLTVRVDLLPAQMIIY